MKINYYFKSKINEYQKKNIEYRINFIEGLKDFKISFDNEQIIIEYSGDNINKNDIINIIKMYDIPINIDTKLIFSNKNPEIKKHNKTPYDKMLKNGIIYKEMDGVYLYFGIMNKLYISLNNYFRHKMLELGAEEVYLPSMLSIQTLETSGYVVNNGNLCNYIAHIYDKKEYFYDSILNPAACQPLYKCLKENKMQNKIYTGFSRVYRYEGENYKELSRLREYGIRELVYISSKEKILDFKDMSIKIIINIIQELNLNAKIETATDMFFESEFVAKSLYQLSNNSKFEVNLELTDKEYTSACSINVHDDYFAKRWNLKLANGDYANTFCIGFGIERWCYGILCQFGIEESKWPIELQNIINKYFLDCLC